MIGEKGFLFRNWAKTYSCLPELYFEPKTLDDLKSILQLANENHKKIKVAGNGHSPSSIACTDDYMISMKHFNSILEIDTERHQVKAESGILLEKLNDVLHKNNMSISVLGSISDQTLAGTLSCGTHGTGDNFGIIASYVLEMEMLHLNGKVVIYSYESNADQFPAMLCSLGCLGIILNVTLKCERLFKLEEIQYPAKLHDVLQSLDVYTQASDHFRFFWYPHTDNVICYQTSRTQKAISNKPNWLRGKFLGFYVLEFVLWISSFVPSLLPLINRFYFKILSQKGERVDFSYKIFNFDCLFQQYVYEASIPREHTAFFMLKLESFLDENKSIKAHFPVEIRFTKRDNLWLSPCYEQDSCYINIISFRPYGKTIEYQMWWDFYEKTMRECNGRPHWAKAHTYKRDELEKLYPKFKDFNNLRKTFDPRGAFLNDYLKNIFE